MPKVPKHPARRRRRAILTLTLGLGLAWLAPVAARDVRQHGTRLVRLCQHLHQDVEVEALEQVPVPAVRRDRHDVE